MSVISSQEIFHETCCVAKVWGYLPALESGFEPLKIHYLFEREKHTQDDESSVYLK